jgi:hypothetical protein
MHAHRDSTAGRGRGGIGARAAALIVMMPSAGSATGIRPP